MIYACHRICFARHCTGVTCIKPANIGTQPETIILCNDPSSRTYPELAPVYKDSQAAEVACRIIRTTKRLPMVVGGDSHHQAHLVLAALDVLTLTLPHASQVQRFLAPDTAPAGGNAGLEGIVYALRFWANGLSAAPRNEQALKLVTIGAFIASQLLAAAAVHLPPGAEGLGAPLHALRMLRDWRSAREARSLQGAIRGFLENPEVVRTLDAEIHLDYMPAPGTAEDAHLQATMLLVFACLVSGGCHGSTPFVDPLS